MQETLEGVIERVTHYSSDSGYSVLRLKPNKPKLGQVGRDGLCTVVGTLPELTEGASVRFTGEWIRHKEYGLQFKATQAEETMPATIEGIRRYLGGGMIKGVGPETAKKIVAYFGMNTLDMLEHEPDRLSEVPGIGQHKVGLIVKAWAEQRKIKEVMIFLQSHNVSAGLAIRIYKQYGDQAVAIVRNDPYRLAREVRGIGFKTADKIAQALGLPFDAPQRVAAGIYFALEELAEDGHVYAPRAVVVERAAELLGVDAERCESAVEVAFREEHIVIEFLPAENNSGESDEKIEALYLPPMYYSEKGTATRLKNMIAAQLSRLRRPLDFDTFFDLLQKNANIYLTEQQQGAVRAIMQHKISILTGGPGTGKTTTLRAVIRALEAVKAKYALASPTGRAAKRLSEATGHAASTIHRLLKYKPPEGFLYNENNPLDVDALIIDESSMLDLNLFYNVLKAITPDTHLMLVGDVDQLPSVGAGDVLRDMIKSGIAHVTRLDTIFRQQGDSLIISNAHRINRGDMPDVSNKAKDFFLFAGEEPDAVAELVVDVVKNRIPSKFGYHAIDEIQVLAPMYRGDAGVQGLNEKLQAALNPPGRMAEQREGGRMLRAGDKVMQTRNNYDKDVYNGDIGIIQQIDPIEKVMRVVMDNRIIEYDFSELDELVHAYAVSVHRSQGAEYPAIVMPLVTQHYMMLQRNLLYTAVTRAAKLVVLVGSKRAIAMAVKNDRVAKRYSSLAYRVK
jgi:exodeoxyribonuclease V alpha subunit